VHDPQHRREQLQLCGGLRPTAGTTRRAKATPLAREGYQLVESTAAAAQAQKAVGRDAAFEERFELVLDELGNAGLCARFDLGEKGRGVLLNESIQRGLFGTVTFVLNSGAFQQLTELPSDGLHAKSSRGLSLGASRAAMRRAIDQSAYRLAPKSRCLSQAVGETRDPQLYVQGDPGNAADMLWRRMPAHDRAAVTAPFVPAADGLTARYSLVVSA
jgi:hypothetical protein